MVSLLLIVLGGVIKDDFLVDQDSVHGFQVEPVVAVAPSGNFAIAWEDNDDLKKYLLSSRIYLRFFDPQGTPLTEPIHVSDSINAGLFPRLTVDESGRFMCMWTEFNFSEFASDLKAMVFDELGEPLAERFTVQEDSAYFQQCSHDVCNIPNSGFLAGWCDISIKMRRYDSLANGVGGVVEVYSPDVDSREISISANTHGTVAVAWLYNHSTLDKYIRFQIVDSLNNLVIPDSFYHVCEGSALATLHGRPRVRWLDDERFVIFWLKYPLTSPYVDPIHGIQAKIFDTQGDSVTPIRTLLEDDPRLFVGSPLSPLSVSSLNNGLFAIAYERKWEYPLTAVMGFLADTSLTRTTGIFRLASSERHELQAEDNPSVDANSERIVWVWQDNSQKRLYDTSLVDPYYSDVHCKITDWNLVGVDENPPVAHQLDFEVASAIGSRIVLRFWDCPSGFKASVFDVSGRKVDEIHTSGQSGTLVWGECYGPGVYFIKTVGESSKTQKVVLVK